MTMKIGRYKGTGLEFRGVHYIQSFGEHRVGARFH